MVREAHTGGLLLVSRGFVGSGERTQFRWDGFAWREQTPAVGFIQREAAALVYESWNRSTVLFGGISAWGPYDDTWRWDGQSWSRFAGVRAPAPRWEHAMAAMPGRDEIVLFGGYGGAVGQLGDTWVLSRAGWSQRRPVHSPSARQGHVMAWDAARQRVVLFGGASTRLLDDTWEWDGQDWIECRPQHVPPRHQSGAMDADEDRHRVLLTPGLGPGNVPLPCDLWEWDGRDWSLAPVVGATPPARFGQAIGVEPMSGRLLLSGGRGSQTERLVDTWLWDPGTGVWSSVEQHPLPRLSFRLLTDTVRQRVVMHAEDHGLQNPGPGPATWAWNGAAWARFVTNHVPTAAEDSEIVYDSRRGVVVKVVASTPSQVWEFDGVDWMRRTPAHVAPPRRYFGITYDSVRGEVVTFGGRIPLPNSRPHDQTWTWDGTDWRVHEPAHRPPAMWVPILGYDERRGVAVLFGGPIGASVLGQTWEWNGVDWSLRSPDHTPPTDLSNGELIWDPDRQVLRLLGDSRNAMSGGGFVWEWDGVDWLEVPIPVPDSQRLSGWTAFDPVRRGVLLFGDVEQFLSSQPATWFLTEHPAEAVAFGAACAGTGSEPQLRLSGRPSRGMPLRIEVSAAPSRAPLALAVSIRTDFQTIGNCVVLHDRDSDLSGDVLIANAAGVAVRPIVVPMDPALLGATIHAQAAVFDRSAPLGFTLTQGLRMQLGD